MHLYRGHTGSLFFSDHVLSIEEEYCETCGDYDDYIGDFNSAVEVIAFLADDIDVDASGGWDMDYVLEVLSEFDDCPTPDAAAELVRSSRTYDPNNYDEEDFL